MDSPLLWLILGLITLMAEMATGTFALLFISLGCFVAAFVGFLSPQALALQITVASIVSLTGFFLLRKPLQRKMLKKSKLQVDLGKTLDMDKDLEPQKKTRVSYQGTTWDATNVGAEKILNGDTVTIVGMDGNVLHIRK